ncbi:MAG: tetratricopeptide repeat protein [Deltaproteobacteria bacterium]|nr:tetratricopeptide repeat protein [Deltaproteobacteria bacterium]MBW1995597.1 tetratricopeptide repeat protein [Deltaproteobacteria bacterium]MBW2152882.1 tetratricopeptide repeat protein [Deltaproteobacteria bacterium]
MIDLRKMSVLIVDDIENMCKSIRGMLKVLNYGSRFRFATNGIDAWSLLQKEPLDLAIVDWNMPSMTGVELLSRIRENKNLRDMPVVMVTAESNREIVAEAAESDIDAYILKPLTVKSLGDKISSVVEKANNPPPMFYHLKRARDLEEAGEIDAAINEVKKAMEADPESSKPIRELGKMYLKNNNLEEAERWLNKAAKMNELDVIAFHNLGELYLKRNDINKAARFYDKAMTISPRHVSRGINFGKVLVKKGEVQKALRIFDKAINLTDNSLSVQEEVADFCLENGMDEYAAQLMEFILQQTPNRHDIMYKLGIANENLGQPRKALSYFIGAGKKDRNNLEIQVRIAKNYIDSGQVLRAEKVIKSILDVDPDNQDAKDLLRRCL